MWMIDPRLLCNKHLLGEHGEIHKFRHTFVKKHSILGRLEPIVQISPYQMASRHKALAFEMNVRGIKHNSPYKLPNLKYLGTKAYAEVNENRSIVDLMVRCKKCKKRITDYYLKGKV